VPKIPAVEHQLGGEVQLLLAPGRGAETEGAGEIAGHRAADRAVDAAHPRAGLRQVVRVVHPLRGFRQRQYADGAERQPGAALGIAQQIVDAAYFVRLCNLGHDDRRQPVRHRGGDFSFRAVVQRLDADESAGTGIAQLVDFAFQMLHRLRLELRRDGVLDIQNGGAG
jgi:hypothetical protein